MGSITNNYPPKKPVRACTRICGTIAAMQAFFVSAQNVRAHNLVQPHPPLAGTKNSQSSGCFWSCACTRFVCGCNDINNEHPLTGTVILNAHTSQRIHSVSHTPRKKSAFPRKTGSRASTRLQSRDKPKRHGRRKANSIQNHHGI